MVKLVCMIGGRVLNPPFVVLMVYLFISVPSQECPFGGHLHQRQAESSHHQCLIVSLYPLKITRDIV